MAIAARPNSKLPANDAAEKFIAAAGPAAAVETPPKGRIPTMVRFDAALLAKVDAAARSRGVSRSAWIQFTLSEALDGKA